MIKLGWIL